MFMLLMGVFSSSSNIINFAGTIPGFLFPLLALVALTIIFFNATDIVNLPDILNEELVLGLISLGVFGLIINYITSEPGEEDPNARGFNIFEYRP